MKQIHKVSSKVSRGFPGDIARTHRNTIYRVVPYSLFSEASPVGSFSPPSSRCIQD